MESESLSSQVLHLRKQKPAHPGRSRQDDRACTFRFSLLLDAFDDPGCKTASQLIQMLIPLVIIAVDAAALGNRATAVLESEKLSLADLISAFTSSAWGFNLGPDSILGNFTGSSVKKRADVRFTTTIRVSLICVPPFSMKRCKPTSIPVFENQATARVLFISNGSIEYWGPNCLTGCFGVNSNFHMARFGLWHSRKSPGKPSHRIKPIIDITKRVTPKASQSCSVMISSFFRGPLAGNDRKTDQCLSSILSGRWISMGMKHHRSRSGQTGIQV